MQKQITEAKGESSDEDNDTTSPVSDDEINQE